MSNKLCRAFSASIGVLSAMALSVVAGCESAPDYAYEVEFDGVVCQHPRVEKRCKDGWCEIPPGCFLMGSAPEEPGRGAHSEEQRAVTLTRGFMIQQTELTLEEWEAVLGTYPVFDQSLNVQACTEADCPVMQVSFQEMLAFANRMSELAGLQGCYTLSGCTGELGARNFECEGVGLTTESVYECEGYRLPTEAEWEYAARAGTRTAFYSGPFDQEYEFGGFTTVIPELEKIAWYGGNAGKRTHRVAQKRPNRWGLYDVIGNVAEQTSWLDQLRRPSGPLVDPQKDLGPLDELGYLGDLEEFHHRWIVKGGLVHAPVIVMRIPWSMAYGTWKERSAMGLRLVRTLPTEAQADDEH